MFTSEGCQIHEKSFVKWWEKHGQKYHQICEMDFLLKLLINTLNDTTYRNKRFRLNNFLSSMHAFEGYRLLRRTNFVNQWRPLKSLLWYGFGRHLSPVCSRERVNTLFYEYFLFICGKKTVMNPLGDFIVRRHSRLTNLVDIGVILNK